MRGKLTVVALFAIGLLAAAAGWWQGYQRGQRVLRWWGPSAAALVRLAPQVEIARLTPLISSPPANESGSATGGRPAATGKGPAAAGVEPDTMTLKGLPWAISDRRDISQVRGLVHARQALIDDPSYVWEAEAGSLSATNLIDPWEFLIVFRDGAQACHFAFAPSTGQLYLAEADRTANIQPIRAGLQKFCTEQFAD